MDIEQQLKLNIIISNIERIAADLEKIRARIDKNIADLEDMTDGHLYSDSIYINGRCQDE